MAKENNRSSYFGDVVKKFLAHRLAMMGTIVLILEVLAVVFLPSIMKLDPYSMDYMAFGGAPSAEHLLGCDDVGRDLFARLIFGGRVSLMVGICSALISLAIGVPLGLFAGYFRGAVETVIMRCADIFMSFPNMILILVLASGFRTVRNNCYISNRISWLDRICQTDLCKRIVCQGKGLRRISKSNWCKERHDLTSVRSAKLICTGYHFLYIQNRSGDHYRVILKFLRTWRTASGSFLGKHSVLCTVHQCPVHKAVYVGTRRCCTGPYCIEH